MTPPAALGGVQPILFAKTPQPRTVKTRLIGDDFDVYAATAVADAMLRCTIRRLLDAASGVVMIAVAPDAAAAGFARAFASGSDRVQCVPQGEGDLGARIERVWAEIPADQPVAFFGMDAPDIPVDLLRAIPAALDVADAAVGPTADGGYWTLAACRRAPELVRDIAWGGPDVFDQTLARAGAAGLAVQSLPAWRDVDTPADVDALRRRLAETTPADPALQALASALDAVAAAR